MKEKFIIIIFPTCLEHWDDIDEMINHNLNIINLKNLSLDDKSKFELILNLYDGESWLGNKDNNYDGLFYKLNSCFPNNCNSVKIYCVKAKKNDLLKIKLEIRKACKVGNHSIHTTDTIEEFNRLSKIFK